MRCAVFDVTPVCAHNVGNGDGALKNLAAVCDKSFNSRPLAVGEKVTSFFNRVFASVAKERCVVGVEHTDVRLFAFGIYNHVRCVHFHSVHKVCRVVHTVRNTCAAVAPLYKIQIFGCDKSRLMLDGEVYVGSDRRFTVKKRCCSSKLSMVSWRSVVLTQFNRRGE